MRERVEAACVKAGTSNGGEFLAGQDNSEAWPRGHANVPRQPNVLWFCKLTDTD